MNFVGISIRRPVMVTMVLLFFVVMGVFSYFDIAIDMIPRVDVPIVTIVTVYPGASPSNVETLVSKQIEDAVSSINGIDKLRSSSYEGFSNVILEFDDKIDVDAAASDVREKISASRSKLPDGIEEPVIMKLDINSLPVVSLAVTGPQSVEEIFPVAKDYVKEELAKTTGVADVSLIGNREREILVQVSQSRLKAYGFSVLSLAGLLAQKSHNIPSGHITQERMEYSIRMDGEFTSVQEIREAPIPLRNGKTITLGQIADVRDTHEELRQAVRLNGQSAVGLVIKKRSDANSVETCEGIIRKVEQMAEKLPAGMKIQVTRNRSTFIQDSIDELNGNLQAGIIITGLILFLFLHSFKATVMAVVSLPVAIIGTYILLYLADFTINMMTLQALAISVGILVNNAIIVMENIYVHIKRGKDPKTASEEGTNEIIVAVSGATLTNVVVFVPIAFMTGMVGKMFYQFGMTVTFATFLSLLVAFTMTPLLCAYFLKPEDADSSRKNWFGRTWDKLYGRLETDYQTALKFSLNHKLLTVVLGILALLITSPLGRHIGFEFVTEPDQKEFDITLKMPPGTSLERTNSVLELVEKEISKNPEVKHLYTKLGKTESMIAGSTDGVNLGEISVALKKDSDVPTDAFIARLTPFLARIPEVEANVRKTGMFGTQESPIQIYVTGDELEKVEALTRKVAAIVADTRGTADVQISFERGKPEVRVIPRREEISKYGLTELNLAAQLRSYFEGDTSSVFREKDDEFDIRIKLDKDIRSDIENIRRLNVILPGGQAVPLVQIANIEETSGPARIDRYSRNKAILVTSNVLGRSLGEIITDIRNGVKALDLPAGYDVIYTGTIERMEESFSALLTAMAQAVIFTYMLMAALLESFIHPFTILLSFPLSFCGILVAMFLTGKTISIFSLMAIVMLVGIVVNNGILMFEQIKVLRDQGTSCLEAVVTACPRTLRPILMTAAATIFAMVPLALGQGAGGEMRAPMAIISIGGLFASTVLSMFMIPVIYHFVETRILRTT